jgi:hypothetical protein
MEQYGIYPILQHIAQQHPKLSYNFQKAVFSLILSRFVQPVSKLSLYDQWMDKFYPDKVDANLALHHIYRSLNILADELRKKQEKLVTKSIEKKVVKPRSLTVPMALKELSSVLAIPVRIEKRKIWVMTDIRENALKVMKALNMKVPPKILKIEEEVEK